MATSEHGLDHIGASGKICMAGPLSLGPLMVETVAQGARALTLLTKPVVTQ